MWKQHAIMMEKMFSQSFEFGRGFLGFDDQADEQENRSEESNGGDITFLYHRLCFPIINADLENPKVETKSEEEEDNEGGKGVERPQPPCFCKNVKCVDIREMGNVFSIFE